MNFRFNWLDMLIVVGYFVGITLYGVWLTKKVKNSDKYFCGERKFNKWIMMGQERLFLWQILQIK